MEAVGHEIIADNSLNPEEAAGLKALVGLAFDGDKFPSCSLCRPDVHPKPRGKAALAQARRYWRSRGCIGRATQPYTLPDKSRYWTCPRRLQRGPLGEYFASYGWYEDHGTLLVGGGLMDQPAKWTQAVEVIRGTIRRIEKAKQDEASRKAKQAGKHKGRR